MKTIDVLSADFIPDAEIDFHDYGKIDPFEVEMILERFLEDCYIEKKEKVLIITGKGQIVRPTVEKILGKDKHVKSFETTGYFGGQDGAFEARLLG